MAYRGTRFALLCAFAMAAFPTYASETTTTAPKTNGELAAKIKAGEEKAKQLCASCHGADGNSANPQFPSLAGQVPGYVSDQLQRFKSGERANDIMKGIAAGLADEDMAGLDMYYTSQSIAPGAVPEEDKKMAERGERLYRGGYAPMSVSACMSCHGPSGHGVPRQYPRVAGQKREYLEQQLLAFKSGKRMSYSDIMNSIAFRLSEQQIKEVSAYMHALK